MKFLVLIAMTMSLCFSGASAAPTKYYKNDGRTPPELLTEKPTTEKKPIKTTDVMQEQESPISSESGILNSSGVTTDQMNTSPNTPPASDKELLDDATLSTGRFHPTKPGEIQAQETEDALDYSTTPQKRTTKPLGPNKK